MNARSESVEDPGEGALSAGAFPASIWEARHSICEACHSICEARHFSGARTAEDRFAGATDVPLSDTGHEQARRLSSG